MDPHGLSLEGETGASSGATRLPGVRSRLPDALRGPAVTVLVGAAGSGKSTVRHAWVADGLDPALVVSLDDLRREARAADARAGRPLRPLQRYSLTAVRRAARRCDALAAFGAGYLVDATHLRRRERRLHVDTAHDTGLPARAVLMPELPVEVLVGRNAARPADEQVPIDVLAAHAHRRSLLTGSVLRAEGFHTVVEL